MRYLAILVLGLSFSNLVQAQITVTNDDDQKIIYSKAQLTKVQSKLGFKYLIESCARCHGGEHRTQGSNMMENLDQFAATLLQDDYQEVEDMIERINIPSDKRYHSGHMPADGKLSWFRKFMINRFLKQYAKPEKASDDAAAEPAQN